VYLTLSQGRALLRFTLSTNAIQAILTGKIGSMKLILSRSIDCEGDVVACNGLAQNGQFQVFPLTNAWVEGSGGVYAGADWCRMTDGNPGTPWNLPGADGDHGPAAGLGSVDDVATSFEIVLDPSKWDATWILQNDISMLVVPVSGAFVLASKDSDLYNAPRLEITVCP
jgi:hypothetical protein